MNYAQHLFEEMPNPDPFLWNSMIRSYSNSNSPEAAVSMYIHMLARGFEPNVYTFPFLLKAFTRDAVIAWGDELHAHVLKFGLGSNAHVRNALIHMYACSGDIETAQHLFERSYKREAVMWNAMISGHNRNKQFEMSCKIFVDMVKQCVSPTAITYISVISACAKLRDLDFGIQVHKHIKESGTLPNLKIENALVDMYAECCDMDAALRLFEGMKTRDVISWTALVVGFARLGQIDRAKQLFNQMPERDAVSWTAMIDGYVRTNQFKEALEMFRDMQTQDFRPDEFTMVSVLTACAQLGALEMGNWVRVYMDRHKIKMDVFVQNALIDMYSKCGRVKTGLEIFHKMHERDKFTWTAMIVGLAINGHGEDALQLFNKMLRASESPDEVTFIGVLTACAHAGLVSKGRELFLGMITTYGIKPNVTHYACMIDLLGRAGHLKEAFETTTNMPMRTNSAIWGTLLGACRVHGNAEMAELAAKNLLELEPENGTAYVQLSNIYAKCKRWDEVRRLRQIVMERGIKKEPGCSMIEMNGEVHEFVAGDRSHPRSEEIYTKLGEMAKELKIAGYVPDTSEVLLETADDERENAIFWHSEKLAMAYGLISSDPSVVIRIVKNLRMCLDCHRAIKLLSKIYEREVVVRDRTRFHHFRHGLCTCRDYW
ncbi:putative pentatricopeptide repeat-containing protein At3g15930 [Ananas comosus]|uniref:Pentatricopeptide repeat-containing protein At3g15930 n=1 Tax=Ananas comosus TaxID=4615 RepID=A0A6P5FUJ5_ANACO|nr:putative pentatricopeptide repeat-containing protein At3g15930 [Ananas comosus]